MNPTHRSRQIRRAAGVLAGLAVLLARMPRRTLARTQPDAR
jgi:hypothetical protein